MSFIAVAVGTIAVGAGVSAYGAYQSGVSQNNMAKFQAASAAQQQQLNTRSAEQNISITQLQASQDTKSLLRKSSIVQGAARAAAGANGIAGSGTALDIDTSNFDTQKLDEMSIRYNADLKSWGIKEGLGGENWNLQNQQTQYKYAGKNALRAGYLGTATSLLNGASQAAGLGFQSKLYSSNNPGAGASIT